MEVFEGNPVGKAIWDFVWKLPVMQKGEQGAPIKFGDVANVLRKNIEQIYGACVRTCVPHAFALHCIREMAGKQAKPRRQCLPTHPYAPHHDPCMPRHT